MRIIIGSLRFVEITQDQQFFGCELILLKNCNQQFAGSLIWQKTKTELNSLLSSLIYLQMTIQHQNILPKIRGSRKFPHLEQSSNQNNKPILPSTTPKMVVLTCRLFIELQAKSLNAIDAINVLQSSCTILIQDSSCSTCLGYLGLSARFISWSTSAFFPTNVAILIQNWELLWIFFSGLDFIIFFYFLGKRITKFFISQNWGKNNPTLFRTFSSSIARF